MEAKGKIRILLADDHFVVRSGLASILSFEEDLEVVGETDNGVSAVEMAKELKPDVVLMDLKMPKMDGAEATVQMHRSSPETKVLILTTFGESVEMKKALEGGAAGALVKSSSQEEIIGAIRRIAAGGRIVSREIMHGVRELESIPSLSSRQLEILNLIAKGFSNQEIAKVVGVSLETVKDHIKKILARLNASSRTEAASFAVNLHLITG
ncbi:MAG: response regulator transcription factor [Kiritimatiellae bacterium]|nr:response regulator transcription factor [Kiritimatiellia bacterium]